MPYVTTGTVRHMSWVAYAVHKILCKFVFSVSLYVVLKAFDTLVNLHKHENRTVVSTRINRYYNLVSIPSGQKSILSYFVNFFTVFDGFSYSFHSTITGAFAKKVIAKHRTTSRRRRLQMFT